MAASTGHPNIEERTSRDRHVRDRTAHLFAREAGRGKAVVLLHAVPFNSRIWEQQLEALSTKARLIAPDLPGFGSSPMRELRSLSDYAEAVVVLLDHLGVEEVIVAGVSSGAYIAFEMIAPLGHRLKGLVIAGALATPYAEQKPLDRRRLAAEVESGGLDAAAEEYLRNFLGQGAQRSRELLSQLKAMARENSPQGVAAALRAIADRPDFSSILREIRCPTLCIAGAEDPLTPPEQVRDMAGRIPVAQVATIAGAGHLVNLEAPETFNREFEKFLGGLSAMDTPTGVDHNGVSRDEAS